MDAIKDDIRDAVEKELASACEKFPMFSSLHEGYAVLKEEYEESMEEMTCIKTCIDLMWNQVKLNNSKLALSHAARIKYAAERLAIEACQVSAMAEKMIQSERSRFE